jgi:hypothetical protein
MKQWTIMMVAFREITPSSSSYFIYFYHCCKINAKLDLELHLLLKKQRLR